TFPYEPPFAPGDPVPTFTYALDNSTTTTDTEAKSRDIKVGLTVGGTKTFTDLFKAAAQSTNTWTWSCSKTKADSSGATQSASVTIGGPSFGYTGPTDIAV